jgi:formate dehydrogenase major subunit
MPGTNVACSPRWRMSSSPKACRRAFVRERCDWTRFRGLGRFVAAAEPQPEAIAEHHRRAGRADVRAAARLYATGGNGAIYYGLGVTEHSQGSTTVMAIANLAMATGNIGRRASA